MKPYTLKVALSVASVDLRDRGAIKFLVQKWDDELLIPTALLFTGETSHQVANRLFAKLTGQPGTPWITIRQVGFFDLVETGEAIVLYGAVIPETMLGNDERVRWVDADDLMLHPKTYGYAALAVNYIQGLR